MQYCPKCRIYVRGDKKCCPLCHSSLEGKPENPAFPVIPEKKVSIFQLWKIALFLFLSLEVALSIAWYLSDHSIAWIPFAMILDVILIADVFVLLYYQNNVMKMVTTQIYVGMLAVMYIDANTGHRGWSMEWVVPAAFLALIFFTFLIEKSAHLRLEDYAVYLIFDVLMSLLQLVFIHLGFNPFPMPAVISVGLMIIFAGWMMIFHWKDMKNAGGKYLHLN